MSQPYNQADDDLPLRTRGSETRTEREPAEMDSDSADREFTLSTGTVLALFFALALICAVFFGFGYTMGRKSAQTAADTGVAADGTATAAPGGNFSGFKPAPGSPAIQAVPGYLSQAEANAANEKATTQSYKATPLAAAATTPATPPGVAVPVPAKKTAVAVDNPDADVVGAPKIAPVVRTAPVPAPVTTAAPVAAATAAPGLTYVQIAAVSHQEDADVLLSALKRRGYAVLARNDAADRLIHVQIGPFSNRKDAEAIRQKLLGDGYNAFLK